MSRTRTGPVATVFVTLALAAATSWAAKPVVAGGDADRELRHGGLTRTYSVHVPPQYDGKSPVPLVLSFHGRHGTGEDQAKLTGFNDVADRHGFIVVYPDGYDESWNALHGSTTAEQEGVDDVGFVAVLIDELTAAYAIDPRRIYAAGMSNGGFFSHRLGCELSTKLAAIASVAGQMAPDLAEICTPREAVAVLDIHGTRDRIVPYEGGSTRGGGDLLSAEATAAKWRRLNDCSETTEVTLEKGDVRCSTYQRCEAPVTLCTVKGGGHTWPGGFQYLPRLLVGPTNRDVDASEMIWDFFAANPKTREPRKGSEPRRPETPRRDEPGGTLLP